MTDQTSREAFEDDKVAFDKAVNDFIKEQMTVDLPWSHHLRNFLNNYNALTHANAEMEKMRWQPIETAPKDDWVLLFDKYSGFMFTSFLMAAVNESGEPVGKKWFTGYNYGSARAVVKPTHWMPLPPTPKAEG